MILSTNVVKQMDAWLIARRQTVNHRQIVWVQGDYSWALALGETIAEAFLPNEKVWLGERDPANTHVARQKVPNLLGTENDCILVNGFDQLDLRALYIVTGTLRRNGILVLLSPRPLDWPNIGRCLSSQSYGFTVTPSHFLGYFTRVLLDTRDLIEINQNDRFDVPKPVPVTRSRSQPSALTDEQQDIADILQQQLRASRYAALITARRGRGKSFLLGHLVVSLLRNGKKIALVAPQSSATNQIFKHLDASHGNQNLTYCAIDNSALEHDIFDLVVVDESAAIPVYQIQRLANIHSRLLFSTTMGGYEGSGNGFKRRAWPQIKAKFGENYGEFKLITPLRWAKEDPIEDFLTHLLEQDNPLDQLELDRAILTDANDNKCTVNLIEPSELLKTPELAKAVYGLLTQAHYQTTPTDFVRLFDATDTRLFIVRIESTLVGAALCINEGNPALKQLDVDIAAGKRRVNGNLSPQYLAFNTTESRFCHYSYLRINRIAIAPTAQSLGFGTRLLNEIITWANSERVSAVTTVYGDHAKLNMFWQSNHFLPFKVGKKIDKASGLESRFCIHCLDPALTTLIRENTTLSQDQQRNKINHFLNKTRNLSSVREAICSVSIDIDTFPSGAFPLTHHLIVNPTDTEKNIISKHQLSGKKALYSLLRQELTVIMG